MTAAISITQRAAGSLSAEAAFNLVEVADLEQDPAGFFGCMIERFIKGSARVIQVGETPIKYLDPGNGKTGQGYFWVAHRSGEDVFFERAHDSRGEVSGETHSD